MKLLKTIRNCSKWKLKCPKQWTDLKATRDATVRFCGDCERDVHFCATDEETLIHARAGHCVAREEPSGDGLRTVTVGRPGVTGEPTPSQREASARRRRERGINQVLDGRLDASRACPECHYPVQSFRKTCYVCGYEIGRQTR